MSSVAVRVAEAVKKDPSLKPIAERYVRAVKELSKSRRVYGQSSSRRLPNVSSRSGKKSPSSKAGAIAVFLKQLAEAKSPEEVREIQEKYRKFMGRKEQ